MFPREASLERLEKERFSRYCRAFADWVDQEPLEIFEDIKLEDVVPFPRMEILEDTEGNKEKKETRIQVASHFRDFADWLDRAPLLKDF
jgi:hypothetical protein